MPKYLVLTSSHCMYERHHFCVLPCLRLCVACVYMRCLRLSMLLLFVCIVYFAMLCARVCMFVLVCLRAYVYLYYFYAPILVFMRICVFVRICVLVRNFFAFHSDISFVFSVVLFSHQPFNHRGACLFTSTTACSCLKSMGWMSLEEMWPKPLRRQQRLQEP